MPPNAETSSCDTCSVSCAEHTATTRCDEDECPCHPGAQRPTGYRDNELGAHHIARPHDLRQVYATLVLRAGVPVHVVAAQLGPADAVITLRVYADVRGD